MSVSPNHIITHVSCAAASSWSSTFWRDQQRAYKCGLKIGETSATDYMLLHLADHFGTALHITKFSATDESLNGADWEWWFKQNNKCFGIRIQAKRLEIDPLRYEHLDYKKKGAHLFQVDDLITHAGSSGLLPLYFFYNYWRPDQKIGSWHLRSPVFSWSTSFALAEEIQHLVHSTPRKKDVDAVGNISAPLIDMFCLPRSLLSTSASWPSLIRTNLKRRLKPSVLPRVKPCPSHVCKADSMDDERLLMWAKEMKVAGIAVFDATDWQIL